jgi:hypothetical protein
MARTSTIALVLLAATVCATSASAAPVMQGKKKDPQVFSLSDCTRLRTEYEQAQAASSVSPGDRRLAETYATQAANQCDGNYTYSGVSAYSRAIQLMGQNPAY